MDSDDDDGGGDDVSFRMVLPSESHRKQSRDRLRSASESVSSLATSHGDLSGVCIICIIDCMEFGCYAKFNNI